MILETNRLILRKFEALDAQYLLELNNDPLVLKYTGDLPFINLEDAEQFVKNYKHYDLYGFGRWSVLIKDTQEFIGWCGLKKHDAGYIDIGFRFFRRHWNNGYATESAKACIEYGFTHLQLKEIVGRASKDNTASIKVLEKLGMSFWKHDDCNGIENAVYYRLIRS